MSRYFISLVFALLTSSFLPAACVYVDCSGSVTSATEQTGQLIQEESASIQEQLDLLEDNYKAYADVLELNNQLYEQNRLLKAEYLILLKKINHNVSKIKLMEAK